MHFPSSIRSILALSCAFSCSACYGPSGQVRTEVNYSSNGASKQPVRVGSKIDVSVQSGNEVVLMATETPLCAQAGGVTRSTTKTPIRERRGSGDGTAAIWIGVGGTMGGAALLSSAILNSDDEDDESRAPRAIIGGALLGVGAITLLSFFARSNAPYTKDGKPTTTQTNGVGISMDHKGWTACGPPKPIDVEFDVALSVQKKSFSTRMRTGSDGRLVISQQFLAAAGDAEALCGAPVKLVLNLSQSTRGRYTSSGNVNAQDIFTSSRRSLAQSNTTHWGVPFSGSNWLEFGANAGAQPGNLSDRAKLYDRSSGSATFNVRASSLQRPGVNSGPSITRDAIAFCSSRWTSNCVEQKKPGFGQQCYNSCYNADAIETCALKHEICIEQTAGIGGTLAQQCDKQKASCIRSAGQDNSSISSCQRSCQLRLAQKACR